MMGIFIQAGGQDFAESVIQQVALPTTKNGHRAVQARVSSFQAFSQAQPAAIRAWRPNSDKSARAFTTLQACL